MKIAIPTFRSRLSPVFDWCERLLIIEKMQNDEMRMEVSLANLTLMERVNILLELNIEILICGVVSESLLPVLESKNIHVIPGIAGTIDEIIEAFFMDTLKQKKFTMPGCQGLRREQP
ncbi:MAG: NifB/NifX family molybdenum-iron cluster-binding protein [Candidatus Magnetomorum sp.]|nr:NifB/NifX family molybdenum-iron cluster-binding protein [Candidatus Magnetomorum sp.]